MKTAQKEGKLYSTRHDIKEETRRQLIELLNVTLATTLDLQTQTKQAHWNVRGATFIQLHELFDEMQGELLEYIDEVAERITALAGQAMGTARVAANESILPEYPLETSAGEAHLKALAERYGIYAKHVRDNIAKTADMGDADTSDLYTEISRTIDKRLWFLEAHLSS